MRSILVASVFLLSVGCASARIHITTPEGRVYDVGARAFLWEKDNVIIPTIDPLNPPRVEEEPMPEPEYDRAALLGLIYHNDSSSITIKDEVIYDTCPGCMP